jgi:hypothetical protein
MIVELFTRGSWEGQEVPQVSKTGECPLCVWPESIVPKLVHELNKWRMIEKNYLSNSMAGTRSRQFVI